MNELANLARMTSTTQGVGTLTLVAAVVGCLSFADAGVANGAVITYTIEDYSEAGAITAREIGQGTYTSANLTLTRTTVYNSTNGGSKINCSGRQHVQIAPAKEDFDSLLTTTAAAAAYQPLDADLTALAALTTAAYGRSLLETSSEATFKAAVNLEDNVDVVSPTTLSTLLGFYQPVDADLTALAALSGTNTIYYRSAANTWSAVTVSASLGFSGGTLGGSLASNYQPLDTDLTAIAALTSAADKVPYATGAGTWALNDFSSVARTLVSQTTQALMRTTGLGCGTAATATTGTSGATVPFLNGANTFSAQQIIDISPATSASLVAQLSEDSATAGPAILVRRISTTPAANDNIGYFNFQGRDSGGTNTIYAQLICVIVDPTDTSEDGSLNVYTSVAGTITATMVLSAGMRIGTPTGGDKGVDTLNVNTIYEAGASLAAKYGALASANVWTAAQTVRIDNATTNAVTVGATISHTTSGTPANGIGVSLAFEAETSAGNNEVGATIEAITTDVTSASEDFDISFKAMAAGAAAAEVGRMKSTGTYKMPSFTVAGLPAGTAGEISFASNGRKNGEGAAAGTGVLVFHDGTAWRACDTGATVAA